ncbi:MAG: hypothetical protein IT174_11320 [Acidobacteria bacterium]|nr:hypothetical protein [Acidobacteriota bacterium]
MRELSLDEWKTAELILATLFKDRGYELEESTMMAFYVVQTIQNGEPLYLELRAKVLDSRGSELNNAQAEEILGHVHMLLQNYENVRTAHKMLMYDSLNA